MPVATPRADSASGGLDDGSTSDRMGRLGRLIVGPPVILVGLLCGAFLLWQLRVEVVILFAALLFGTSLYAAARWLTGKTGLAHGASVSVWVVVVAMLLGGFFVLTQQRLSSQYGEFSERLPRALEAAESRLEGVPILSSVGSQLREVRRSLGPTGGEEQDGDANASRDEAPGVGASSRASGSPSSGPASADQGGGGQGGEAPEGSDSMQIVQITLVSLGRIGLVVILSLYMAYDGRRYVRGVLMLFPPERREVGSDLVRGLGTALPRWLLGRVSSMAVVSLLTAPGLILLGIPLALVLALIAGLFSFVPVLGPIAAVLPAILITLEAAPEKLIWVLALYGAVQLLESWFITPRIQDGMADVPPALLLSAQFIMGALVGLVGVMFSTPVALAALIVVQVAYLRNVLDEPVQPPGDPEGLRQPEQL